MTGGIWFNNKDCMQCTIKFAQICQTMRKMPKFIGIVRSTRIAWLYFQLTVAVLLVGTILVSSYGYIDSSGSAIQCMMDKVRFSYII